MHYVDVRELKNRLTYYLKLTKQGDSVIVTECGKPMAILHTIDCVKECSGLEKKLISLAGMGMIRLPARKARKPKANPVEVKGMPLSKIIIEERR